MKEIWKDIQGYEGLYQISNLGRVKSLKGSHGEYREKILKCFINTKGYIQVELQGKPKLIHRIVAKIFITNPDNKPQVNHIDGNKTNNRVDNLEWCTYSENMYHAWKTGLNKGITGQRFSEEHKKNISKSIRKKQNSQYK